MLKLIMFLNLGCLTVFVHMLITWTHHVTSLLFLIILKLERRALLSILGIYLLSIAYHLDLLSGIYGDNCTFASSTGTSAQAHATVSGWTLHIFAIKQVKVVILASDTCSLMHPTVLLLEEAYPTQMAEYWSHYIISWSSPENFVFLSADSYWTPLSSYYHKQKQRYD